MKRLILLILSVALCPIIVAGYVAGTRQEAGADDGFYGKYVLSVDPTQYIELRSDGSCLLAIRVLHPSGEFDRNLELFSGTYNIIGDFVNLKPVMHGKTLHIEFRLERNTLVPPPTKRGTDRMEKAMEGAKYIKK